MYNLIKIKKHKYLEKNIFYEKGSRQYLPLTKEWNNSIYNFHKNNTLRILLLKDKYIYKLLNSYFNLRKIKTLKRKKFSIIKVYISKPDLKHINNTLYVTLCIFNKEKISYKKHVLKFYKKALLMDSKNLKKNLIFIFKFLSKFNKVIKLNKKINIFLLLKYKKYYILYVRYLLNKYKKLFVFKKILVKLKFINYKYNINNFLGIKNILNKMYNKKIQFNIINVKYVYLDSNILTEAVGAKLKNRKVNLLKSIIKSISSVKIPYVGMHKYLNQNILDSNGIFFVNYNLFVKKNKYIIKDSLYTSIEKLNIALYKLKYKIIKGIKIQGSGRLTKRLTALRSVSKFKQKGNLKNIYSSYNQLSTVMLIGYIRSNLQYIKKNYNNRNGSYGIKTYISSY